MTVDGVVRGRESEISTALSSSASSEGQDTRHLGNQIQNTSQDAEMNDGNSTIAQRHAETPMEICQSPQLAAVNSEADGTPPSAHVSKAPSTIAKIPIATNNHLIDCLQRQKVAVKKCLASCLAPGQQWQVLSMVWFKRWQQYVGYRKYEEKYMGKDAYFPGSIDNSDILEVTGELKPKLMNESDYVLIRGDAWTMLVEYYELAPGQEAITRSVISRGGDTRNILEVEVYQLIIELGLLDDDSKYGTVACQFSKSATFGDVADRARDALSLSNDQASTGMRFWLSSGGSRVGPFEPIVKSMEDRLDGYINSNDLIFIELANFDGVYSRPFEELRISGPELPNQMQQQSPKSGAIPLGPPPASSPPSLASTSSLSSTWSSRPFPTQPGLCGLVNMGNTCFMNSAIQCLSNVPILTEFMLSDQWRKELNTTNPLGMRGEIAKSYAALIESVWSGSYSYIAPRDFKAKLCEFAPQFSGFQQHDCQELMAFLLDGLHEDLNRIVSKPYVEIKEANNRPDAEVAAEAWNNYKLRNDSIIVDLFHGQLKSTLVCPECSKVSVTFDPFGYLSLPLPQDQSCTFTFRFIRLDPDLPIVKCKLTLPPDGTMALAYRRLSEMFELPQNRFLIGEVYYHKFHRFLVASDSYAHITDRGQFHAFELREPFDPESKAASSTSTRFKYIYFLDEALATRSSYVATMYFGFPLLLELDMEKAAPLQEASEPPTTEEGATAAAVPHVGKDGSVSQAALRRAVIDRCRRFLDNPARRKTQPETYSDWWRREAPEQQVEPPSFNLYATRNGSFIRDTAMLLDPAEDDEISTTLPADFSYIWVGLPSQTAKRLFYDEVAANAEQVHSSAVESSESEKAITLDDCLKLYTDSETLDKKDAWHCPNCKVFQCATKKIDLWSLPPVLVCHLKRFSYDKHYRSKIDSWVEYPLKSLNLRRWIIQSDYDRPTTYNLLAVAHHFGNLGGGHYTASALNHKTGIWHYYDDNSVRDCTSDQLMAKSAYVLVYIRSDLARPDSDG